MSHRRADIAIVGGGLAAHAAAATLLDADADFAMVYPPSPGATALWSGLGSIFGPPTDLLEPAIGQFGSTASAEQRLETSRKARFDRLVRRRPHHPYRRLALGFEEVATEAAASLASMGYPGWTLLDDERIVPSADATPSAPDIAARGVAASAIREGETVGVVDATGVAGWRADRLVDVIQTADGVRAHRLDLPLLEAHGAGPEHPVRAATRLVEASDSADHFIDQLADELATVVSEYALDLVILPPIIGRTFEEHNSWMSRLGDTPGCRVAEGAGARWSIHGWRLDRFLRGRHSGRVVSGRATTTRGDGAHIARIETKDDIIEADAFILASGAWIGGGLPTGPPLTEPLFGLDLWLDGAPLPEPAEVWPPDHFHRVPWGDHSFFRIGVAIDEGLRPLRYGEQQAFENLYCAGRILSGTSPFLDGTTEGVDLVTGRLAAKSALSSLDVMTHTEAP